MNIKIFPVNNGSFKEKFHGYSIKNIWQILNKELINKVLENANDFYGNLEKNKKKHFN